MVLSLSGKSIISRELLLVNNFFHAQNRISKFPVKKCKPSRDRPNQSSTVASITTLKKHNKKSTTHARSASPVDFPFHDFSILYTAQYRHAVTTAAACAKAHTNHGRNNLSAIVRALHTRIASILSRALLVSILAASQLRQQSLIIYIVWFKCTSRPCMVYCNRIVSNLVVSQSTVIIPCSTPVDNLFKHIQTFAVITILYVVEGRTHILFVLSFLLTSIALTITL